MLSGIGHAQHLRDHGIDVPPTCPSVTTSTTTFHADLPRHVDEDARDPGVLRPGVLMEALRPGRTFLANSVFESVAFVRTSQATDVPDL